MSDPVSTRYKQALQRGHVAVTKGRPREAVQHYEEAGGLAKDRPLPYVAMGSVFLQMRNPGDALSAYDEALRRAPGDLEAMRGKAQALEAAGKSSEAQTLGAKAAELSAMELAGTRAATAVDPMSEGLEVHIAEGVRARREGNLDRALGAYLAAAHAYAQQDDYDSALDACFRALEARPGNIDVHLVMAGIYLRLGWREHGVQRVLLIDYRLRIDEDPGRRAALTALAHDHEQMDPELERVAASAG
jgi:tetratricopeptide (TPR) repeat protein